MALLQELRAQEIRSALRGLDPLERTQLYTTSGNATFRAALAAGPAVPVARRGPNGSTTYELVPFVDPAVVDHAYEAELQARFPAAAENLQQLVDIAAELSGDVTEVRRAVLDDSPSLRADTAAQEHPGGASAG